MPIASEVTHPPEVDTFPGIASTRRALLFFLSGEESYRRPLFSSEEIFCGPDASDRWEGGKARALKTAGGTSDVREILDRIPPEQKPDYVVVKADATGRNFPRNLSLVPGPRILLVGDTHHMVRPIQSLVRYAREEPFDFVIFDHTRHHARFFAEAGLGNLYWLPALDFGFLYRPLKEAPAHALTFVGQAGRFHPYRRWLLGRIKEAGLPIEVFRGRLEDTADIYSDSRLTLNISLNGDLNLRVFEALAAGGFLLTDELGADSGLRRLFEPGRHLVTWRSPDELFEKIRHYLSHPAESLQIRRLGQEELLRNHHPATKVREFERLIDGGEVNPRYDLRSEPWWPRGDLSVPTGLDREIAAYEALQEWHRTARELTVFAEDPQALDRFQNLPRLRVSPFGDMAEPAFYAGVAERQALWWDGATPASTLARFRGDLLLAPDEPAAVRPELGSWGFSPVEDHAPAFRLVRPMAFLERAWEAGARDNVLFRLPGLIGSSGDSCECVALANYARRLGKRSLQETALRRAVGLDRDNATALLALAAMTMEEGDPGSSAVLLEEAARTGPLPEPAGKLRRDLAARPAAIAGFMSYWRAIGRVPEPQAARPLRILIVTNLFPPQELGGYGRMMWEFARGLRNRGHTVRVLTSNQPDMGKAPTPDELEMELFVDRTLSLPGEWRGGIPAFLNDEAELSRRSAALGPRIVSALREFGPDVMLAGNLDFLDTIPVSAAIDAGIPVLHALGNIKPGYGLSGQPDSERYWVAPGSDWNGRALRQGGYSPARIETLYPGARIDRFFRVFLPDTSRLRICFAGLVLPYKGPHVLVDALARLEASGVDFTAEIAGDAPDQAYFERLGNAVRAVGLSGKVSFPGFLDRGKMAALFARSNVLVFPSTVPEMFGISQVEAMAAGLVVVSSGTGGAVEVVRHDVDGLLFAPERADELALQLVSLARDPALMARLQRAGQVRAMTFAVEHSVRKIESLFDGLLALPREEQAEARGAEDFAPHDHAAIGS